MLQHDPVMVRFLAAHEPFQQLINRMYRLLTGDDSSADVRVPREADRNAVQDIVLAHPSVQKHVSGQPVKKVVVVPG